MKKTEDIPVKNPFKVPDNYFEEVNRKIISATAGDIEEIIKPGLYRRFRPYILAAASVTGFIILSYTATRLLQKERTSSQSDELYSITLTEPYINDIDIMTLEENVETIELSDGLSGIRKSEIIDYLILENIEINDIYEE
jgi:hypothetical protein